MQLLPTTYTLRRRDTTDHTLLIYREYLHAILPEMTDYTVWFHDTLLKQIFSALNGIIWFLKKQKKNNKRISSRMFEDDKRSTSRVSKPLPMPLHPAVWSGVGGGAGESGARCAPFAGRPQDFSTALSWTAPSNQLRSPESASSSLIHPPSITETWRRTSQAKWINK